MEGDIRTRNGGTGLRRRDQDREGNNRTGKGTNRIGKEQKDWKGIPGWGRRPLDQKGGNKAWEENYQEWENHDWERAQPD